MKKSALRKGLMSVPMLQIRSKLENIWEFRFWSHRLWQYKHSRIGVLSTNRRFPTDDEHMVNGWMNTLLGLSRASLGSRSLALSALLALLWTSPSFGNQNANYAVLRNGDRIGTHKVEHTSSGALQKTSVDVDINVYFGFVPLYSFRHQSTTQHTTDSIATISSTTTEDGELVKVTAKAKGQKLHVATTSESFSVPVETPILAYFHPSITESGEFLDITTGELVEIEAERVGLETITVGKTTKEALRTRIRGKDLVDVWFVGDSLLKLELEARDGSIVSYIPEEHCVNPESC